MSNLLVMFADISESVRLYESLGDAIAHHKITQCLNTIMTVIQGHNGNVIKTMGDEVMGTFSTVEAGIAAGCEMQSYLEDQQSQQDERPSLAIHIGMHYGPVILEKGDVFGDTVNIAKRVANMAKIGQIITTESVAEKLSPPWRARTRHIDRVLLKGKKARMDIFEVIWQSRDITFKRIGIGPLTPPNTHLYLHYQDRKLIIDETHGSAVLGRSPGCDITIDDDRASRHHLKIENRRGRFYIIDQSTNGTYFRIEQDRESFLRHQEILLSGNGQFSLGRPLSDGTKHVIHFEEIEANRAYEKI